MFASLQRYFSKDKSLRLFIKNILGFYPGNVFLYELAFRHRSVSQQSKNGYKVNNERLEYLGDAILSAIVADFVYKKYPTEEEGFLTEMRSKIVSRKSLNSIAFKMGIPDFIQRKNQYANSFKSIDGDTLEALIGAIYLDKGYPFTQKIIIRKILQIHLDIDKVEHTEWNFKSKLLNAMQREHKVVQFRVANTEGTGPKKIYHIDVVVDGEVYGHGKDYSIKAAEQSASEKACSALNISSNESL